MSAHTPLAPLERRVAESLRCRSQSHTCHFSCTFWGTHWSFTSSARSTQTMRSSSSFAGGALRRGEQNKACPQHICTVSAFAFVGNQWARLTMTTGKCHLIVHTHAHAPPRVATLRGTVTICAVCVGCADVMHLFTLLSTLTSQHNPFGSPWRAFGGAAAGFGSSLPGSATLADMGRSLLFSR